MNEGWTSGWAAPHLEADDRINVTPGKAAKGSRYWLGPQIEELRARRRQQARNQAERAKINALRAIALFVASQIHPIPGWLRWIAFFASIICAAIAANAWDRTLTHREQAGLFLD